MDDLVSRNPWGKRVSTESYTDGGIALSSEIERLSDIYIDKKRITVNVNIDGTMQIADLAVAFEHWTKWHYIRFFSFTKCGRFYTNEAYIVDKDNLFDKEICKTCLKSEQKNALPCDK